MPRVTSLSFVTNPEHIENATVTVQELASLSMLKSAVIITLSTTPHYEESAEFGSLIRVWAYLCSARPLIG